jgi:hypothetical protein
VRYFDPANARLRSKPENLYEQPSGEITSDLFIPVSRCSPIFHNRHERLSLSVALWRQMCAIIERKIAT